MTIITNCQAFVLHDRLDGYNQCVKTREEIKRDWYEFANNAFVEFRGNTRATISDFADYIGISQSLMSYHLSRDPKIPRDPKAIAAWASKYPQVYEILDLPVPGDSMLLYPEPFRSIALSIKETLAAKHIDPESPEAGKLVDEIMKKHGYNLISTDDDPSE